MVQPFVFPNQSEASATYRNSRRRGAGTIAVRTDSESSSPSSTPRISDSRRNRVTTRKALAVSRKLGYSNCSSGCGPETLGNSDDVDSGFEKRSPLQEIALKGQEIFWFILREELSSREKAQPGCLRDLTIPPSKHREQILGETISGGSHTLRNMAREFSTTSYRQSVRELAESVDLTTLSFSTFSDLLNGLFQAGEVTRERVLVLYYFCCDLALKAAFLHLSNQFRRLVQWISYFISTNLSVWVDQRGGWAVVLQESTDYIFKLALTGFCLVGIVTCVLFISNRTK